MDDLLDSGPLLSSAQREELAHIAFFLEQWDQLHARSLIGAEPYATVLAEYAARRDAILRDGRMEAILAQVHRLSADRPAEALVWARRLIELAPERREGWAVATNLARRLKRFDEALALRAEAPFDDLPVTLADLEREKLASEEADLQTQKRLEAAAAASRSLESAREAARTGRYIEVISHCEEYLRAYPTDSGATALLASAHEQLGELEKALDLYRQLQKRQPGHLPWIERAAQIERRLSGAVSPTRVPSSCEIVYLDERDLLPAFEPSADHATSTPAKHSSNAPAFSMAAIAGEFVKEHWQKLILCLAVLLIVVSSTVGAHHLLGERLVWSRAGQCVLAVIYTSLIAAFGYGLVRWGAERAGRIMLLTTLFVVPVNFSLAGELRLVILPSWTNLSILLSVLLVLFALVWVVTSILATKENGLFALSFFVLAAFDASAARGVPFGWGFSALIVSAWIFLGAVWRLNTRLAQEEPTEERRDFAYFALGLLGYAFLFFAYRSGVFVLRLIPQQPTLMAVPTMLTAIACVHTAYYLPRLEKDSRRVSLLRLAGYVLAGLAFTLALAHPPAHTPLIRLNTLVTACLGLALFARSLSLDRQPSHLYAAFAALCVAYFGVEDIVRDALLQTLAPVREALGYHTRLPLPFRALNGIVLNVGLAILALRFRDRWHDERLARHCHYIGVPLSIAACVLASVDPKAALLCLPLYVLLYVVAAWLYAQPLLVYLACGATLGTTFAFARLNPSIPLSNRALGTAVIGMLFWSIALGLRIRQGAASFRLPLLHMALLVSAGAVTLAMASAILPLAIAPTAIAAVFVASLIALLVALDLPIPALGYYAVACANLGVCLVAIHVSPAVGFIQRAAQLAIAAETAAVVMIALGAWIHRAANRQGKVALYRVPLIHVGLIDLVLGLLLGIAAVAAEAEAVSLSTLLLVQVAIMLTLSAAAAFLVSRSLYPTQSLAHACVVLAGAAYSVAWLAGLRYLEVRPPYAALAVIAGVSSGIVYLLGARLNREELYQRPLLRLAFAAVAATWILSAADPTRYTLLAIALTFASGTLIASVRLYPFQAFAHAALFGLLGAWICAFKQTLGPRVPAESLWCACTAFAVIVLASTDFLRLDARRRARAGEESRVGRTRVFLGALPQFALALACVSSLFAALSATVTWPLTITFALAAVTLLGSTRIAKQPALVYLGLGHVVIAALCLYRLCEHSNDIGVTLGGLALTVAFLALILWSAGKLAYHSGDDGLYALPCTHFALGLAIAVSIVAVTARVVSPAAFPLSLAALVLNGFLFLLLTTTWRQPALTYASILTFTAATYLILFRLGTPSPDAAFALGFLAVVDGILLWLIGSACLAARRESWSWLYCRPLFVSTLVLTVCAVPVAYNSPWTMGLTGLSFLLLVKSFPSERWLYAAFAAFGCAAYYAWLAFLPEAVWMQAAAVGAFALWTLGLLTRRFQSTLCRRLGLKDSPYDAPCFHASLMAISIAIVIRFDMILWHASPPTDHAWLPLAIALLCVLMLKPYPRADWVHGAAAFLNLSLVLALQPKLDPPSLWLTVFMSMAIVWEISSRSLAKVEARLCRSLGVEDDDYAAVLSHWSFAIFALSAIATTAVVVGSLVSDRLGLTLPIAARSGWGWTAVFVAIVLGGVYSDQAANVPGRGGLRLGLFVAFPLAAWWLGLSASPLIQVWRIDPATYDPLITVALALAFVLAGVTSWSASGKPRSWLLGDIGELRRILLEAYGWLAGVVLSGIALALTEGTVTPTTAVTLLVATTVFAAIAVTKRWAIFGSLAGITWIATIVCATLSASVASGILKSASPFWVAGVPDTVTAAIAALAAVGAAFSLLGLARMCDPGALLAEADAFGRKLARALEECAVIAAAAGIIHIGLALASAGPATDIALPTVAALVGLAIFAVLLAHRWNAAWPVFAAQVFLVAAYFDYRLSFPLSAATDAIVLLLFAYIDFAIADTLKRYDLELYSRPTHLFSLAMPLLPLALAFREGVLDDITLFTVFVSGAFYTVASVRLQRKSIGYAAAVLYNAFLWIAWSRVGWRLDDSPQFFLVPVGLTTILFAEANRRALGKSYVNALRNLGLVIIYLSLAYPVWQHQSFGAWLGLLIFSLAGIFVGIGLQVQSFLWLGLACFCLDVLYQLGRMGMENSLAKWGIMLLLGILLVIFVALNEKKRIVFVMRDYLEQVRHWE